jgi:amino acid adenylation domain-containing protein
VDPGDTLTQRQSLFWLDEKLYPEAHYNNLVLTMELRGVLDEERLRRAWRDTVLGCDALQVVVDADRAVQRFGPRVPPALPVHAVEAEQVEQWILERSVRPLLGAGPPWNAALLRVGPEHHVFVLFIFHGITDGTSANILLEEFAERYAGGTPAAPGATFHELLRAEAAYRSSEAAHRDQAYWEETLQGGSSRLRLYGRARTAVSSPIERAWLDAPGLGARLGEVAGRNPFTSVSADLSRVLALATGFSAYLYRVTGSREIVFGLPVANRPGRFARTPGLLMQPMFLRVSVAEGDTFAALARRTRLDLRAAMIHSRWSLSNRNLEYATLNLLPAPPRRFADLEARVELRPAHVLPGALTGPGDLRDTVGLWAERDGEGGLRIALELHRATFPERLRRRAREHLTRMLEALAADPNAAVDTVDLLGEEEALEVRTAAHGPEPAGTRLDVVEALALQAHRTPERIAVEAPGATLTYRALERVSNQLARRLREMGVVRGSRVGVAVPRGAGELASLLAVLKAGGAYVPLDDSHPIERIRLILEDAAPEVLIAPSASPLLPAMPAGARLLPLDDLARAADGFSAEPLGEAADGDQVAYVLFTSGSTGKPKGVEVPRGAFANFLRSMQHEPGMREGERLLAITTTTFDIAGLELFLPLSVGGTVVIADRATALDPRLLRAACEGGRIAMLQATPATWRLLIEAGWTGDRALRALCGGEALTRELAEQLLQRCGELWNMYGPTETTVWSTLDRITSADQITIGRPIDRTQVYVLGPGLGPVPTGVVGELFIGGDGVALGYRGKPELTAERFVPNPYGPGKLYRTGDLGRLLEDGRFECLGRADHQVKVRGFRVELGEIESTLRQVDGVRDAVVVADASGSADARLIAYWLGEAGENALHERARARLPSYMVPAAFVHMVSFPLTTSGKVDRKKLPAPDGAQARSAELRFPSNALQARMAAIWSEVLGVSPVGVDQDFFALGGTSVDAIKLRARVEKEFGMELPLRTVFTAPTVERLVQHLGELQDADEAIVVPLRNGPSGRPPLFCLHGIDQYAAIARALSTPYPVLGVHVPVHVPGSTPHPPVPEVARRYVEAIRRQQPEGPYRLLGFCMGGILAFEAARQLERAGQVVDLVTVIDGYLPDALSRDLWERLASYAGRALRAPLATLRRACTLLVERARERRAYREARRTTVEVFKDKHRTVAVMERYQQVVSPVAARVILFSTSRRPELARWEHLEETLGWKGLGASLTIHEVDAEHLKIVRDPHARDVARVMESELRS